MSDSIGIVILAAGKGTRLKIETPKPLCPVMGKTLVDYVLNELNNFAQRKILDCVFDVVVGHSKDQVQSHISNTHPELNLNFSWQKEQLGTGHALQTYFDNNKKARDQEYTLVVCADTPLIQSSDYERLYDEMKSKKSDAIVASFITEKPFGYGRIVHSSGGLSIVEEKDASSEQKCIKEVNSALYLFRTEHITKHIYSLDNKNKSNELYLTDLFKPEYSVSNLLFENEKSFIGVNNLVQLAECEQELMKRKIESLQLSGVRFLNPMTVYLEQSVEVMAGAVIYPSVTLLGKTKIGAGTILESGVFIKDSQVGKKNIIKAHSYFEGVVVDSNTQIGPMARLREGTEISSGCKIGNFVETKKAKLAKGSKVSHLSYVGDAEIGEETNIGCGFITCNYDGTKKHKTIIGKNSFIGSDCQVVAPINIGDEAYVGSGSTITDDIPSGAFAIARSRQTTKENMAKKFIKK